MTTCDNFAYMMLNLVGEVGEFSSKVAKLIRKGRKQITDNGLYSTIDGAAFEWTDNEFREELKKEAGDILWQLAGLCREMGWDLEDVARGNLNKLASRQERGVIDGNGDNR